MSKVKLPLNLKHKPIIAIQDYDEKDGNSKFSDAKHLSIGRATYDNDQISAKVWRFDTTNDKWKRQSDDLPLHRIFDLGILVMGALLQDDNTDFSKTRLNEKVVNKKDIVFLKKFLLDNKNIIDDRINILYDLIREYKGLKK